MKALFAISIMSLVFLAGCLDVLFVDPNKPANTPVACEVFSDQVSKDSCFTDRASGEKNVGVCMNVSPGARDNCIRKVADARGEGSICLEMASMPAQIACADANPGFWSSASACEEVDALKEESCNRHAARILKNEAFCYVSGDMRNDCLIDVAKALNNTDVCELIGSSDKREECFIATALNAKDSGACQKISLLETRESCLNGVAEAQSNAKLCELIDTPAIRASCLAKVQAAVQSNTGNCASITDVTKRDDCFKSLAGETKQVDTCTRVIGQATRNDCYVLVGKAIGDDAICFNIISDDAKRQECLQGIATAGGTVDSCYILPAPSKDECISGIATKTKNASLCLQLTTTTNTINYRDDCLSKVAVALGDGATCGGISSSSLRDTCLSRVGVQTKNELTCGSISDLTTRNTCYTSVAAAQLKSTTCLLIAEKELRDACVKAVALAAKSASLCDSIDDTLTQDQCYSEVAAVLKDKSTCDKIVNKSIKDPCILLVATSLNDWQYCLKISTSNPHIKQECLGTVASKTGSTEPCTHIASQADKGLCYGKAGLLSANFSVCEDVPLKLVEDPIEAHLARDTCWNYIATTGNGADLCVNIYDEALRESCE